MVEKLTRDMWPIGSEELIFARKAVRSHLVYVSQLLKMFQSWLCLTG